jgi:hypothetical protein
MKQPETLPINEAAPIGIGFGDLLAGPAWEYLTGGFEDCWPDEEQKKLCELGKQGWELVAVITVGRVSRFYLKRPANSIIHPNPVCAIGWSGVVSWGDF